MAVDGVDLFAEDPYSIKTLHRGEGMAYELGEPTQPWSWRGMLNGMQEQTLDRIVGNGIIGICCKPIEGAYDHKRRHAARLLGHPVYDDAAPVPIWDFVVTRVDGSGIRFHVSQTNRKVELIDVADLDYETEGPRKGKGKSDGKGTYRRMLASSYNEAGAFRNPNPKYPPENKAPATAVAGASDQVSALVNTSVLSFQPERTVQ